MKNVFFFRFRMIDASTADLRDPIDRTRKMSTTSSIHEQYEYERRKGSICSTSTYQSITGEFEMHKI